ncbi:EXS-domain-containing protein [Tricholoma matsutake]|nr:EXS-domain-containing protein [Tricholoma matsutake 945]
MCHLTLVQAPEWKKAYIDYRGLKKMITAICEDVHGVEFDEARYKRHVLPDIQLHVDIPISPPSTLSSIDLTYKQDYVSYPCHPHLVRDFLDLPGHVAETGPPHKSWRSSMLCLPRPSSLQTLSTSFWVKYAPNDRRSSVQSSMRNNPFIALPLDKLLSQLSSKEAKFFAMLDSELQKIEAFYLDREEEMRMRWRTLREQLNELGDHMKHIEASFSPESKVYTIRKSTVRSRDPDHYFDAKKKLKKAVLEYYRTILNLTGFRKALKKFEKVTKVEKSVFASSTGVRSVMSEIQDMYAALYVRGDKKKAMVVLRAGTQAKTHHFSTWRSGLFMGLALPAFAAGLYLSFQTETRNAIPGWNGLLFMYGVLLVPVLFGLLLGLNLLVWARSSINYVFIFGKNTSTSFREYITNFIPSILLACLCYAFVLSFSRIGPPLLWPLIWLVIVFGIMFNPSQLLFRPSRFWFLKNTGKILLSGLWHIEVDQFCSFIFTFSNFYFIGCVYANGSLKSLDPNWETCSSITQRWPAVFTLASLPLLFRLLQSIRRFVDSKHVMHLINGGKYGTGIISYLCFYIWRQQGPYGTSLGFYFFSNLMYSVYSLSWDFLMDWSLFQPQARYPLLRKELVYPTPFYYIAIVLNIVLKFCWLSYLPPNGPSFFIRTFICGLLEMLRRWLWNFFRVENEHLGNVEQYRVTREVPLPYSFGDSYTKIFEDD